LVVPSQHRSVINCYQVVLKLDGFLISNGNSTVIN
jgi:hypothetical protein